MEYYSYLKRNHDFQMEIQGQMKTCTTDLRREAKHNDTKKEYPEEGRVFLVNFQGPLNDFSSYFWNQSVKESGSERMNKYLTVKMNYK